MRLLILSAALECGGWTKSSRSTMSCVVAKLFGELVLIRDSKNARLSDHDPLTEPIIVLPAADWDAFLDSIRREVEVPGCTSLDVLLLDDGGAQFRSVEDGTTLTYTKGEWDAFVGGVRDGELTTAELAAAANP